MMSFLNNELFPALLGAVFGLLLSIIFDEPLRDVKRNIKRRFRRLFKVKNDFNSHLFTIGDKETDFYIIDGDGEATFDYGSIETNITQKQVELPGDIQGIKDDISREENKKREENLPFSWNGSLYGLTRYRMGRDEETEEPTVVFTFHQTDYYTFLATNANLNKTLPSGKTIKEKYVPFDNLDNVVPFLANGFGIVLVLITSDEHIILTKRSSMSGARANEYDVSVVEGIHPKLDQGSSQGGLCFFSVASRGAKEELNIEIDKHDIHFLGYGVDTKYYQWNMIGYAYIDDTAEQVRIKRSQGAPDKWEAKQIVFEVFSEKNMANIIKNKPMWSTAQIALYWTARKELSRRKLERLIEK